MRVLVLHVLRIPTRTASQPVAVPPVRPPTLCAMRHEALTAHAARVLTHCTERIALCGCMTKLAMPGNHVLTFILSVPGVSNLYYRMLRFSGVLLGTVLGLLTLTGCPEERSDLPKTVPASGVVTLDGKPVEGAQVVFIDDTSNKSADGMSDSKGQFSLNAFPGQKTGAQPGSYKVQVSKTVEKKLGGTNADGGENLAWEFGVPKHYSNFNKSGLTASIPEEGVRDLKIELKSK